MKNFANFCHHARKNCVAKQSLAFGSVYKSVPFESRATTKFLTPVRNFEGDEKRTFSENDKRETSGVVAILTEFQGLRRGQRVKECHLVVRS